MYNIVKEPFMDNIVNIKELRSSLNMTQAEFSKSYGIPFRTVQNWEYGERKPDKTAQSYLKVIKKNPKLIKEMLEGYTD